MPKCWIGVISSPPRRHNLSKGTYICFLFKIYKQEYSSYCWDIPVLIEQFNTILNVPYTEKDETKIISSKGDVDKKSWYGPSGYGPSGIDISLFSRWIKK